MDFGRRAGAEVSLFGSTREPKVAGHDEFIEELNTARITSTYFDVIWDCAFITREKLTADSGLTKVNDELIRSSTLIARKGNYGSYLYFSSGASQIRTKFDTYSDQKLTVEMRLAQIADESNFDVRVIRLWNVTVLIVKKTAFRHYFDVGFR